MFDSAPNTWLSAACMSPHGDRGQYSGLGAPALIGR
ncbi:hypothetical protein BH11GEM2_BH11GEM2_30410 [soil metagenome]